MGIAGFSELTPTPAGSLSSHQKSRSRVVSIQATWDSHSEQPCLI